MGPHREATAWLLLAAVLLSAAFLALRSWRIDYPYSIDFQVYWLAGARVAGGDAGSLYAPGGGEAAGTPRAMDAYEFKNLPIVATGFAPLAGLDYLAAKRVFWWVGLASLLASAVLLGLHVLPPAWGGPAVRVALATALVFASAPAHISLRHGQTTPLVLLAVTGYLVARRRDLPLAAGVFLGLACLVKLPLLAVAGLDILRRRWRSSGAWAVTLAGAVFASVAIFGVELHRQYLHGLRLHAGTVMTGHNNQSIAAMVARLTGPVPVNDWTPVPLSPGALAWTLTGTLGVAALVAVGLRVPGSRCPHLDFAAVLAFGVLVLPVAWDHYFLLLVPGLLVLAGSMRQQNFLRRPAWAAALAGITLCLALPTPRFVIEGGLGAGPAAAVALSHYGLGAVALIALAAFLLRRLGREGPR